MRDADSGAIVTAQETDATGSRIEDLFLVHIHIDSGHYLDTKLGGMDPVE